jgi:hypothetical protein
MMLIIGGSDEEDEKILGQIQNRLVMLPVEAQLQPTEQKAFDRSLSNKWLVLIDVRAAQMNTPNGIVVTLCRIFHLSDSGVARVKEIKERKRIDAVTR